MARLNSSRIYGKQGSASVESGLLLVAFLTGIVGGIALKLLSLHPILPAAFAGGVLIVYALAAYFVTALRSDSETIGDNCYYLGFLFTLTSLAVTLYFVVEAAPADRSELIPEVISGFGVALSSTIVGVFLRVFMMQFKIDVEDRERRTRVELDEAARRFRSELGISLDKVKRFSTESFQQAAEREERMRLAFDKILADMQSELLKSAGQFGPALRDSVNSQTEQILEEVSKTIEQANKKTCDAIEGSMSEMTSVATKLSQTNIDAAKVVANGVEELRATAEKINDEAKVTLLKLTESVAQQSTFANDATVMLEKQSKAIDKVLSSSTGLLEAQASALENSVMGLKAAASRSQEDLVTVQESQECMAATISSLNNVLKGASDKLDDVTTTKVSEFEVSMASLSKAIQEAASAIAEAGEK